MLDLPVEWPEPRGSFNQPVTAPDIDPGSGTLQAVCFNPAWTPVIIGALEQLLLQATWKGATPADVKLAQDRAVDLIGLFGEECPMLVPGMIVMWGGEGYPDGWLPCKGAWVSRTTYAALFAVIGTTYGDGDGSTTFSLPFFDSRMPIGAGQWPTLIEYELGEWGGEEWHTLTSTEMPTHNHADSGHVHSIHSHIPALALAPGELPVDAPNPLPEATSSGNAAIGNAGGGAGHYNIPPFLAVNFIIKT